MRRLTLAQIRREAWRILKNEVRVINITATSPDSSARCEYNEGVIEIWADPMKVRIEHAVIHEILHVMLDEYLVPHFVYHVHEYFITSLEKPFFNGMTESELNKWRKAIRKKQINKRS